MEYTINEVFDIKEEQIYQANEFLSKSEHELLTSSLKKHTFYNWLINNILYLCVT